MGRKIRDISVQRDKIMFSNLIVFKIKNKLKNAKTKLFIEISENDFAVLTFVADLDKFLAFFSTKLADYLEEQFRNVDKREISNLRLNAEIARYLTTKMNQFSYNFMNIEFTDVSFDNKIVYAKMLIEY